MPKLIENLREIILQTAKNNLLSEGYDKLSLREVSRQCNIAVGTIYNYFPSKIALITAIMLEDWRDQKERMQKACDKAENVDAGLESLFANLREFTMLYQDVWHMAMHSKEVKEERINGRSRRQMLIEQLAGFICVLLERFEISYDTFLPRFIATSLITYSTEPDFDYEQLDIVFKRILYGNTQICTQRGIL
ncbi:MAG: TetR/AcrR family transcriptional regulator [Clostridiaceae bacterium]